MARYSWLAFAFFIGIAAMAVLLLSPQARAWQSGDTYSGTGDWTVNNPTVLADQALVVPGNVVVNGQLTLYNATLRISSASDGQYALTVSSGGNLSAYGSLITASSASFHYKFVVYGALDINESTVSEMWGDKVSWVGGIQLRSDQTLIRNSNITLGSVGGISIWNCSSTILDNNITGNGAGGSTTYSFGIYVNTGGYTACTIRGNRIHNNTFASGTARYGTGIRSEYQNPNDIIAKNTVADNGFTNSTTPNGIQIYLYYSNVSLVDNTLANGKYQLYNYWSRPPTIKGGVLSSYINLTACYHVYSNTPSDIKFEGTYFTGTYLNQSFYGIQSTQNVVSSPQLYSYVELSNCTFEYPNNALGTTWTGYIVYVGSYTPLNISNCTFLVNLPSRLPAPGPGTGSVRIYLVYGYTYSPMNITDCTFSCISSYYNYGIRATNYSPLTIRRCTLDFVDVPDPGGTVGTVYGVYTMSSSSLTMEDCTLDYDMSTSQYYGIYLSGGDNYIQNVTMTFAHNSSGTRKWSYGIYHPGGSGMSSSIDPSAKAGGGPGNLVVENVTGTATSRSSGLFGLMWLYMGNIDLNMRNCSFKSANGAGLNAMGAFQFSSGSMAYLNDTRFDLELGGGYNLTTSTFYPMSLSDIKSVDLINTTVDITFTGEVVDLPLAYLEGKCGELGLYSSSISCDLDAGYSSVTLLRFMRVTSGVPYLEKLVMEGSALTATASQPGCALGFLHLWLGSGLGSSDIKDSQVSLTLAQPSSRASYVIDMYRVKDFGLRDLTVNINAPADPTTVILGMRLQLSSPMIENLTIQGNGAGNILGIYCDLVSRPTLSGCTVDSCALGLASIFYSKPEIYDTNFTNLKDGLLLDLSGNATLTGCQITCSGTSVGLDGASWVTLVDTTLGGAFVFNDFSLAGDSTAWALNCSFNPSLVVFQDDVSSLVVGWWLHPAVTWQNGMGIPGAGLVLNDVRATEVLRDVAGEGGILPRLPVTQYVQTRTGTDYFGPYRAVAGFQDLFGEKTFFVNGSKVEKVVIVDDILPSLVVVDPASGHVQNFTRLALVGTASDRGSGLATIEFSWNGVDWYGIPASARWEYALDVPEGRYDFKVRAVDIAGNEYLVGLDITIDLTSPFIRLSSPEDGITVNTIVVLLEGFVEPGSRLTVNSAPVGVRPDGSFSFPVSLVEGQNRFTLHALDRAGNSNSSLLSLTLDITPPQLVLQTPLDRLLTNLSSVLVSGLTDLDATLVLNGNPLTKDAAGLFFLDFDLQPGANEIRVTASDAAGNSVTAVRTVFYDNGLALSLEVTGQDVLTNQSVFTVRGSTDPDATLRLNGGLLTVAADGSFQVTFLLSEGKNTLVLDAKDPAGNRRSATITVTLDTEPPEIGIISPADGAVFRTQQVPVSGVCDPGTTLKVNGQAVQVVDGNFSTQLTFPEGTGVILVEGQDAAGNTARLSVSVRVDVTAPALAISEPASGFKTGDPTLEVSGTTEPGAGLEINGMPVAVAPDGSFHALVGIGKDRTSIKVTATDEAGNSATQTFPGIKYEPPGSAAPSPWAGTWNLAGQLLALAILIPVIAIVWELARRRRQSTGGA